MSLVIDSLAYMYIYIYIYIYVMMHSLFSDIDCVEFHCYLPSHPCHNGQ